VQSHYSDEEIAAVVRQAEAGGVPVAEIVRKLGISEATFYVWKKRFEGFETPEISELRQLRDENAQLGGSSPI
jgi:putative transposase